VRTKMETREGPVRNGAWLTGPGKGSHLAQWAAMHASPALFSATCCEVTAMMLREEALGREWQMEEEEAAITNFLRQTERGEMLQVTFGEGWDDVEHVVTLVRGGLLHSWYGRFPLRRIPYDPERLRVSPKAHLLELLGRECGGEPFPGRALNVYYWRPAPNA